MARGPSAQAPAQMRIEAAREPLDPEVMGELREKLQRCPDVAFAHLPQVFVSGQHAGPELVLFVWLEAGAVRSLRSALNAVSAVVARTLPEDRFLDVVILNSAPELLEAVEAAGCLVVERNPAERRQALEAAKHPRLTEPETPSGKPWWWPF